MKTTTGLIAEIIEFIMNRNLLISKTKNDKELIEIQQKTILGILEICNKYIEK
jgi:hypothetical protein